MDGMKSADFTAVKNNTAGRNVWVQYTWAVTILKNDRICGGISVLLPGMLQAGNIVLK